MSQPEQSNANGRKPEDFVEVMDGKMASKYTDPCARASQLSMQCLDKNSYDRTKCTEEFINYRQCKKAWIAQRRSDRQNGRPGA